MKSKPSLLARAAAFTARASGLALVAVGTVAHAAGPDMTTLTSAVDFGTVITATLAVAGLLAAVYVTIKGAQTVIGLIRRG